MSIKIRLASARRTASRDALVVLVLGENRPVRFSKKAVESIVGGAADELLQSVSRAAKVEGFRGKPRQVVRVHAGSGKDAASAILVGVGPLEALGPERLRSAMGEAARTLPDGARKVRRAVWLVDVGERPWSELAKDERVPDETFAPGRVPPGAPCGLAELVGAGAEGWSLGGYRFTAFKTRDAEAAHPDLEVALFDSADAITRQVKSRLEQAQVVADAVSLARDLANTPANELRPADLARRAREVARRTGLSVRVLEKAGIQRERMGGLLGVSRGSRAQPRFIIIEYKPPRGAGSKKKPLVLVGKAVTFDSGGISIKPAQGMEDMKMDMSGGAAILATLGAVAALRPSRPVVGLIPAVENMLGGDATRPGDVLRMRSGLTIEVINTDAEGRLILADALDYARKYKPDLVVDVATLTGACVVALGNEVSGLMANSQEAIDAVDAAAARSGEKVWELPLYSEFFEMVKSEVADIKNSGGRWGGAITAAALLAQFIEDVPWCHIDIAGTAWTDSPRGYNPKGATGAAVRTLIELAMASS